MRAERMTYFYSVIPAIPDHEFDRGRPEINTYNGLLSLVPLILHEKPRNNL
jgi:hypothetical protein